MKLMIELILILIALILVILFLLYKIINNKFNILKIKTNKSEIKLKKLFHDKFNIILKIINFLNTKQNFDENIYHDFLNIDLMKIDLVDLNNLLIESNENIKIYLSQNEKIINNKEFNELYKNLKDINIKIKATKKYYNENLLEYNKLINKFPTKFIAKIKRYNEKEKLKESTNKQLKILKSK